MRPQAWQRVLVALGAVCVAVPALYVIGLAGSQGFWQRAFVILIGAVFLLLCGCSFAAHGHSSRVQRATALASTLLAALFALMGIAFFLPGSLMLLAPFVWRKPLGGVLTRIAAIGAIALALLVLTPMAQATLDPCQTVGLYQPGESVHVEVPFNSVPIGPPCTSEMGLRVPFETMATHVALLVGGFSVVALSRRPTRGASVVACMGFAVATFLSFPATASGVALFGFAATATSLGGKSRPAPETTAT
jgi:hypothetical protein